MIPTPIRRALAVSACVALTLAFLVVPSRADEELDHRLTEARVLRVSAHARLNDLRSRLDTLMARYEATAHELERAAGDVVSSYRARVDLSLRLERAQERVDARARAAYTFGPVSTLELLLGARSQSEFASIQAYAGHVIELDTRPLEELQGLKGRVEATVLRMERRQADLAVQVDALEELRARIEADLDAAMALAEDRRALVEDLERKKQELEEAAAAAARALDEVVAPQPGAPEPGASRPGAPLGTDQSELLSLLGPNEGRGCDIPPGLAPTGEAMVGIASWYGWELAGQETATGAIFDPRLFTAANKELPLNVFLRVTRGQKCAIVLVNDRGPYHPGWSFDLAMAVAQYLGYKDLGTSEITAEVLVPAS
jgi:peptidoglycan hydrolase CwlO-like protein